MSTVDEDLARVTIISPTRRVDLALPGGVALGELLPNIVRFSGHEAGTPQEAVHGWVLQRFGEDPLDPNALIDKLAIRDGETLYLRQRDNAMPDAAFDDVVDAVSTTTSRRPSWRQSHSQFFAIAMLILALVGVPMAAMGIQFATLPVGKRGYWSGTLALLVGLASGIAAVALSRAAGRYRVSAALSWSAVALAGLGGYQLVDVPDLPVRVVLAAALILMTATACALAAAVTVMALSAVAGAAGLVLIAAIITALQPQTAVPVAGTMAALLLAVTALLPTLSYQLAQIQLPSLPATAEGILADDEPVQSDIVARAMLADKLLGALLVSTGAALTGFCWSLLQAPNWWNVGLALCIGLALLMRARAFVGLSQRLALLIAGVAITVPAGLVAFTMWQLAPVLQAALLVPVIGLAAVILTHYAAVGYAKVSSPTVGRLGDVIEWLSVMAVVPLALGVVGVYGWVQSLFPVA